MDNPGKSSKPTHNPGNVGKKKELVQLFSRKVKVYSESVVAIPPFVSKILDGTQ